MQKRVISGILALVLVLTLTLTLAQADVRVELDGIDGGSASVTVPEDDSAALLEGYLYQLNGLEAPETVVKAEGGGNTASRPATYMVSMNPTLRAVYDQLVPEIQKIAAGQGSSSAFSLGIQMTFTKEELGIEGDMLVRGDDGQYHFSEETGAAIEKAVNEVMDMDMLLNQLLAHHPYELYWFDKSFSEGAIRVKYSYGTDGQQTVMVGDFVIMMAVSQDTRSQTRPRNSIICTVPTPPRLARLPQRRPKPPKWWRPTRIRAPTASWWRTGNTLRKPWTIILT